MPPEHSVRYSTINPGTGAEWNFEGKRRAGPNNRWERDAIKEAWENYKRYKQDRGEPVRNIDYITNTTVASKAKIDFEANNAKVIGELERAAKRWERAKQYRAAWYTIRKEVRDRYGKKSDVWEV